MTEFLIELYVPPSRHAAIADGTRRFEHAAAELMAAGRPVRLVRSILVPEDETCFLLVEAVTAESVRETAARAALSVERVVETAADGTEHERSTR
jgi:hypothetical protein